MGLSKLSVETSTPALTMKVLARQPSAPVPSQIALPGTDNVKPVVMVATGSGFKSGSGCAPGAADDATANKKTNADAIPTTTTVDIRLRRDTNMRCFNSPGRTWQTFTGTSAKFHDRRNCSTSVQWSVATTRDAGSDLRRTR